VDTTAAAIGSGTTSSSGSPAWHAISAMGFARTYHNLTVLPDGNVLVTGGVGNTNPDVRTLAVYAAERPPSTLT